MEIKNVQAMKILDTFGVGGSFTEYYAMDFKDDVVLMGHDGPGHLRDRGGEDEGAAARRVSRQGGPRPFRGDVGEARARSPCSSVVQTGDRKLKLLVAEGESRARARSWRSATRTAVTASRSGARAYVNEWSGHGPAHHCAVGVGHVASKIEKLGSLLDMEVARVC